MKTQFLFACIVILPFVCISQSGINKAASQVDSANKYANVANATAANVNTTAATIKSTASTLMELPGIFGIKKKAKPAKSESSENLQPTQQAATVNASPIVVSSSSPTVNVVAGTTIVTLTGIDYDKLSTIKERVKSCSSVSDAKMKFGGSSSVITVTHKGSTEDLFALMKEACKDLIKASNLTALDEGKIDLKL